MRIGLTALAGIACAGSAQAHVGHLGEVAGHDHWVVLGAAAAAAAAALWAVLKDREKAKTGDDDEAETAEDDAEQPA